MPGGPHRRYTPEEADELIGPLSRLLEELRRAREVLGDARLSESVEGEPGGHAGGEHGPRVAEAALRFNHALSLIQGWGVVVRDIQTGLCDFPGLRDGREVWLCWRLGEERVGYWHELDAGFAGRHPLADEAPEGS